MIAVVGCCPMGCGRTLVVDDVGHVICERRECPRPSAAYEILDTHETEHIVVLGETTFSIQHPLRERLDGDLFSCTLHDYLGHLDGSPRPAGRYRVTPDGLHWRFLVER